MLRSKIIAFEKGLIDYLLKHSKGNVWLYKSDSFHQDKRNLSKHLSILIHVVNLRGNTNTL